MSASASKAAGGGASYLPFRRRLALSLGALALLALAWQLARPLAPPLYDGLGLGNEPYRYVNPPPGRKATPPPESARQAVQKTGGVLAPFNVATGEMYPQASIAGGTNAFRMPKGASAAVLSIAPVRPPAVAPTGYVLDGNVYRFRATAAAQDLKLVPQGVVRIALRGTGKKGKPSLALYNSGHWQVLLAAPTGVSAQYSAVVKRLGEAALVVPAAAGAAASSGSSGPPTTLIVVGGAAGVLLAGLLLLRLARGRRTRAG